MIIPRMTLLWYLLVHIALTIAQEAEIAITNAEEAIVDPSLFCDDVMRVAEVSKSAKSPSVEQVAASLGITGEDLTSVPSGISSCCSSSLSCYFKGGICLPSWLDVFFSCSEANLCYSSSCTCFKPKNSCPGPSCGGSCGIVGTCRSSCVYPEVPAPYNCGIVPGCSCCMQCPSTCSDGGTCRTVCNRDETDTGSCNDLQACRCCKKKCWGQACGINGYCSDVCYQLDYLAEGKRVAPDIDIGYLQCPKGCQCCHFIEPYPVDPVDPVDA